MQKLHTTRELGTTLLGSNKHGTVEQHKIIN